jgi:segregation and condensation protein B
MSDTPAEQPEQLPPEGISLDELTEAFAQAMGVQGESQGAAEAATAAPAREVSVAAAGESLLREEDAGLEPSDDDQCEIGPRSILEAMLFVGNRDGQPLSAQRAAGLMRGVEPEEIAGLVDELNRGYDDAGCPYRITSDGSGYRLLLRREYHPLRNRFYGRVRQARLSQAAIDVLAIVAYQQPLTGEQVSRLRGRPSRHVLAQLVRRGLLRIERRQTPRRTAEYSTTERFLGLFGLEGLDDLPRSEDLQGQ